MPNLPVDMLSEPHSALAESDFICVEVGMEGVSLKTISVKELNERAGRLLAQAPDLNDIWVIGEVSNLTKHSSGHYYFTLKGEGSELRCTLFRGARRHIALEIEANMKVRARGSVDIYVPRGSYQFNVNDLRPSGVGDLYMAYEALKAKLDEEGLFDPAIKRPLPTYPRRIGVVTSPTGAAIQDILQVSGRRFPADILISPALVQGEGAAESIVKALRRLEGFDVDLVIVGRGGGSIEDLWAFNEEIVARAIRACPVPVISAVGHETDFTIADFVADLRAPTPSAAAELALRNRQQELRRLQMVMSKAEGGLRLSLQRLMHRFQLAENKLSPRSALQDLGHRGQAVDELSSRAEDRMRIRLERGAARLDSLSSSLQALDPLRVLSRGYCVLQSSEGVALSSVDQMKAGDMVSAVLRDGRAEAKVERIEREG